MEDDRELLRTFIATHSEAAFRTLVERHLPLVYAAAWRQAGRDARRAEEVTQAVFTLLAQKAAHLRDHPAVAGWLYTTTHYIAARMRRADQRRMRYEAAADLMPDESRSADSASDWEQLRPVIDDALIGLKESDRTAVVLRYFENVPYAEIGRRLGLSENAARMRVDRALDTLRKSLARRGVESTAAALGAAFATQEALAIPATLTATVSAHALGAASAASLVFAMTLTPLKSAAIAAVIIAGATGLYLQHRTIEQLRAANRALTAPRPASGEKAVKASTVAPTYSLSDEVTRLRALVAQMQGGAAASWQERVRRLREVLAELPEQGIPELAFATDDDWLDAAKEKLESADDYRRAFSKLRNIVVRKFSHELQPALRQYLQEHNNAFPSEVSALQAYLNHSVDAAIWSRYVVEPSSTVGNVRMGGDLIITPARVVDPAYDSEFVVGPDGFGASSYGVSTLRDLARAYAADHGGGRFTDLSQLAPYTTTPREKDALAAAIERQSAGL